MLDIKNDFPIFKNNPGLIYLDSAATSQKPQIVLDAINEFYTTYNANIHRGLYPIAEKASAKVEEVRQKVAKFINADPDEIIFTKNATEAINLVAYTWGEQHMTSEDSVAVSIAEHHANFVPWQQVCFRKNANFDVFNIDKNFQVSVSDISKDNNLQKTKLLALTYISNVLGIINPVKEIINDFRRMTKNQELKAIIDASQAAMHIPIDVKEIDCDFLVFTGHKMFAETGVGILYVKKNILKDMPPFLFGGDMISEVTIAKTTFAKPPGRFEAGTPNISEIISLGTAIDYISSIGFEKIQQHDKELTMYAMQQLQQINGLHVLGSQTENRVGIISFIIDNIHPHDIAQVLAEKNICIRAGHHCAMPLHTFLKTPASARISLSIYNTKDDIDILRTNLKEVIQLFH